jgi:hypothetical protein
MSSEEFVPSDSWLADLLEPHATEIQARALLLHLEPDPRFHIERDPDVVAGFESLLRFVLSTIPDGCEIFVASARSDSAVAALGSGMVTLRWQVVGAELPGADDKITPIRPIPGAAEAHAGSPTAREIEATLGRAGARLDLSAAPGDRELWARVRLS